ncbi:hypothetical protein GW17_00022434 [Ensete ventricosum]|nr:hypothetical protein GW17_00022434 [Ensete ventricosum]RZS10734.1 hypothetical protein BHM03_00041998 [Ensete ventricosum]
MTDEGGEVKVRKIRSRGERELDHHVVGMMGGGIGEDEVRGGGDKNVQEEKRLGDHCLPSIGLVAYLPEAELEAPELIASPREATCVLCPARQQRFSAAIGGHFHDDASSRR